VRIRSHWICRQLKLQSAPRSKSLPATIGRSLRLPVRLGLELKARRRLLRALADADSIDLLRILWPTGVLQDEIDLPHTPVIAMKEADRRGQFVSGAFRLEWPSLRAGDGCDWRGGCRSLVHAHAAQYASAWEWIKVDGAQLAPADGKLELCASSSPWKRSTT